MLNKKLIRILSLLGFFGLFFLVTVVLFANTSVAAQQETFIEKGSSYLQSATSSFVNAYDTYVLKNGTAFIEKSNTTFSEIVGNITLPNLPKANLTANAITSGISDSVSSVSNSLFNFYYDYFLSPVGDVLSGIWNFSNDYISEPAVKKTTVVPKTTTVVTPTPPPTKTIIKPNSPVTYVTNNYPSTTRGPQGIQGPMGSQGLQGPRGPSGGGSSNLDSSQFVSRTLFDNQVEGIFNSIESGIEGLSNSISESVDTETLTVSGNATIGGGLTVNGQGIFTRVPTLAHVFAPSWPTGTSNVADSSLYINPASSVADGNLLGLAVGGNVKFLVDAEGDIYANNLVLTGSTTAGSTTVANLTVLDNTILGDAGTDTVIINANPITLAGTAPVIDTTNVAATLGINTTTNRPVTFGTGLVTANNFASSGSAITGGSINGTPIGAATPSTGAFTTLSSTGATTLGNNSATVAIDSSDWDISTTGVMTGISGITTDGAYTQSGAGANTFSGASSFTAAGTALSVTNNASIGGTINTNTFTATALTFSGVAPAISASTAGTSISLDANGAGAINIGNTSTGNILLGGGSGSTGCTLTNSTGDFACTGNITGASTGTIGYWTRAGTTLSPATSGDAVTTSGNISATGSGTITSAGLVTASNGLTLTTGALNLTATSGALTLSGLSASSINTGANNLTVTSGNFNTTATGINSTAIGATTASTGAFTTLSSTGVTTLGNNSATVAIDSSDWDINATGDTTGIGALSMDGLLTGTLGATITGATVNLNTSSNFGTNIGTGTSTGTITIGNATVSDLALNDAQWSVTGAGAATFTSITGAISGTSGSFTTLTSSGNTTLATGAGTTNTFGAGSSSINTIGSTTTPGALTLHGATTLDNTFSQTGANTFSTGTGAVSLNGATTVLNGNTFTANGIVALGDGGDTVTINSSDWDIDATGVITGVGAITSDGLVSTSGGLTVSAGDIALTDNTGTTWSITNAGVVTAGTYNGQTITSAANFTGTIALATLGAAGTTAVCRNGSNQLATCSGSGGSDPSVTLQNAYNNGNTITTTDARNLSITLADTTTDQTVEITQAGTALAFRVNDDGTFTDSSPFVIDDGGNVGIGTTSPLSPLQVAGNIGAYGGTSTLGPQIYLGDSAFNNSSYYDAAPGIGAVGPYGGVSGGLGFFYYYGVHDRREAMRIDNLGNVGIGTTEPLVSLEVRKPTTARFDLGPTQEPTHYFTRFESNYDGGNTFNIYGYDGTLNILKYAATGNYLSLQPSGGNVGIGTTGPADILHLTTGNLRIGASTAVRVTTAGTNQLILFDGTAPVGTLANGISMYSTAGEAYIMDAAGNATLQSPHENENNYWVFDSRNAYTGKTLIVDMELMMKKLNETFGWDYVHETIDGVATAPNGILSLDLKLEGLEGRIAALEGNSPSDSNVGTEVFMAIKIQFSDIYGVIWEDGILKVANIVTDKLSSKEVYTNKLCVGSTCVTESELKELLEKNNIENNTSSNSSGPENQDTQTEENSSNENDSEIVPENNSEINNTPESTPESELEVILPPNETPPENGSNDSAAGADNVGTGTPTP